MLGLGADRQILDLRQACNFVGWERVGQHPHRGWSSFCQMRVLRLRESPFLDREISPPNSEPKPNVLPGSQPGSGTNYAASIALEFREAKLLNGLPNWVHVTGRARHPIFGFQPPFANLNLLSESITFLPPQYRTCIYTDHFGYGSGPRIRGL
jgi:hypothetical protein